MPSYRTLQQYAIAISVASVIYNGAEGGVSIGLGADAASRSLIFFGIQSGIEVLSAILVLWRFRKIAKPGEERSSVLSPEHLKSVSINISSRSITYEKAHIGSKNMARFGLAFCLSSSQSRRRPHPLLLSFSATPQIHPTSRLLFPALLSLSWFLSGCPSVISLRH